MTEPSPGDLLARIHAVYRACRTYRDRGCATTVMLMGRPPLEHTRTLPFETALVRPSRFRFEYQDLYHRAHMLLLSDESGVRSSWSILPGVETLESVHVGLGGHAGVSRGVSAIVPRLLFPDPTQPDPLPHASTTRLLGTESVAGQECFVLRGTLGDDERTFWVGTEDLLLRRVAETDTDITYEPELDVDLPQELFAAPAEWGRAEGPTSGR